MDSRDDTLLPDELLAQLGWVRALARSLVADPDVTDDVLQQVCLLALRKAPREAAGGPRLRAWLATVTRRLALHAGRAESRRARRESIAARPEALPSTADVAVHREALRRLVDAVTALEEPYYSAVVGRYFEGREVVDIAARAGVTPEAVRQRLHRARQQLRGRLEALLRDDREGWRRAALPLATRLLAPAGVGLKGAGGLVVAKSVGSGTIIKIAAGVLLLICVIAGTWVALGGEIAGGAANGGGPMAAA